MIELLVVQDNQDVIITTCSYCKRTGTNGYWHLYTCATRRKLVERGKVRKLIDEDIVLGLTRRQNA